MWGMIIEFLIMVPDLHGAADLPGVFYSVVETSSNSLVPDSVDTGPISTPIVASSPAASLGNAEQSDFANQHQGSACLPFTAMRKIGCSTFLWRRRLNL